MDLEVKLVEDPDTTGFGRCLGITEERYKEIEYKLTPILKTTGNVVHHITEASKFCRHPNELAFVVFVIGINYEKSNSPFSTMVSAITNGR